MKKILSLAVSLLIAFNILGGLSVLPAKAVTATGNLFPQGDFEGSNPLNGWEKISPTSTLTLSSEQAHSGSYSLKESGRTSTYFSPFYNIYDMVHANGPGVYTISMWVYLDGLPSAAYIQTMIRGANYLDANTFIQRDVNSGNYYYYLGVTKVSNKTWTQITQTLTVTAADITRAAGTGYFKLCLDAIPSNAVVYLDDVQIIDPTKAATNITAYKFTMSPSGSISSGFVYLFPIINDILFDGHYILTVKNTGAHQLEAYTSVRKNDSTWTTTVKSESVVIAPGEIKNIIINNVPTDGTMPLFEFKNLYPSDSFIIGNIKKTGINQFSTSTSSLTSSETDGSVFDTPAQDFDFDSSTGFIMGYHGSDTVLKIPSQINGIPVMGIGDYAFMGNTDLLSVSITYGILTIGDCAFADCSSLIKVLMPNSVTHIGGSAFYGTALASISVPNSVTSMGVDPFYETPWHYNYAGEYVIINGCLLDYQGSSSVLTIPNTVIDICDYAFSGYDFITQVTIPSSVKRIGARAFDNCSALAGINIPGSITEIGDSAFFNTPWLDNYPNDLVIINHILTTYKGSDTTVSIPDGVTSIGEGALSSASEMESVSIPESVTSICDNAFAYCTSLESIDIPSKVANIGKGVFQLCIALTTINVSGSNVNFSSQDGVLFNAEKTILLQCPAAKTGQYTAPSTVTSIESAAFCGCGQLTDVYLPNSINFIGEEAFLGCNSLKSINIPPSVKSIKDYTFYLCESLTEITLPEGLAYIGVDAFYGCSGLSQIIIPATVTGIYSGTFLGCDNLNIYGRRSSYTEDYAAQENIIFIASYAVSYNSNGGTSVKTQYIPENVSFSSPEAPGKTDYYFKGWYKDEACTTPWNFDTDAPSQDTTLYANWRLYGDMNNSGTISGIDALYVLQASSGKRATTNEEKIIADVNKSGGISSLDALFVLQYSTGKKTHY